jgi:hypothetical protein
MVIREHLPKYLQAHPNPLRVTINERFRLVLAILREKCPPEYPVKVHRVDPEFPRLKWMHAEATCHLVNEHRPERKRYFLIVINGKLHWNNLIDGIMHEWAHALTWHIENKNDHGVQWSLAYGRLYRMLIQD